MLRSILEVPKTTLLLFVRRSLTRSDQIYLLLYILTYSLAVTRTQRNHRPMRGTGTVVTTFS